MLNFCVAFNRKTPLMRLLTFLLLLLLSKYSFAQAGAGWEPDDIFAPDPNYYYSMALSSLRSVAGKSFFDVMTNGYGAMYSYASRVAVDDRWRIAAYIRALQLSQNAPAELQGAANTGARSASGGNQ